MSTIHHRVTISDLLCFLRENLPTAHEALDIRIVSECHGFTRKVVGYGVYLGRHYARVEKENGLVATWSAERSRKGSAVKKVLAVNYNMLHRRIVIQIT